MPIPLAHVENGSLWPNAIEELASHKAHLVVTLRGEFPPALRARILTQVTRAVLASSSALGVYWHDANLMIVGPDQKGERWEEEVGRQVILSALIAIGGTTSIFRKRKVESVSLAVILREQPYFVEPQRDAQVSCRRELQ